MLERLRQMSNVELLDTYFEKGGEMLPDGGFLRPSPAEGESQMACRLALELLARRPKGLHLLLDVHEGFERGETDQFGNPATATQ